MRTPLRWQQNCHSIRLATKGSLPGARRASGSSRHPPPTKHQTQHIKHNTPNITHNQQQTTTNNNKQQTKTNKQTNKKQNKTKKQ
jgi:hypothetical protein